MDIETVTNDRIEQELLHGEAAIARTRATQMVLLREVDRRQMPTGAGCGSLGEWVRGRLDVSPETARDLVATAHRLEGLPDVEDAVAAGVIGFDRAVAVGRFAGRDDRLDLLDNLAGFDIAGIRHLASQRRRMTRVDEECAFNDRYLTVQPNIDESAWSLNGRLPGLAGKIVIDALEAKADTFPAGPGRVSRAARNADALWAISLDALVGGDGATIDTATPLLTVFVDATEAAPTNGQAGVTVEPGPRVGAAAIEAILCDGTVEVTARTATGVPLALGRRSRVIPPRLRRWILARDGAVCTVAGCTSRYRLQIHHITRWVDGGRTDAENLTTLCYEVGGGKGLHFLPSLTKWGRVPERSEGERGPPGWQNLKDGAWRQGVARSERGGGRLEAAAETVGRADMLVSSVLVRLSPLSLLPTCSSRPNLPYSSES